MAEYFGYSGWSDTGATSIIAESEHSFSLEMENKGNKSVKVRNVIDLIVDFAYDDVTVRGGFIFFLIRTRIELKQAQQS